jgi:hypothetical protein
MKNRLIRWNLNEEFNEEIYVDSFFCSNVIEHIKDDMNALVNIAKIESIRKGVFIVPGISSLYNEIDKSLGHYRRYNKENFSKLLSESGFRVINLFSFNKVGVIGWFVQGSILKKKTIGVTNMKIYNHIFPLIKILDQYIPFHGLSIAAVVEKR